MNNILVNWKEYYDNTCKGEDMWGHYKTSNGELYIVADGASNYEEAKTGADVVHYDRLKQDAANIVRSRDI